MIAVGLCGWGLLIAPTRLWAEEPTAQASPEKLAQQATSAFFDGIRTETLANGLKVYLKPIPSSPVVTTMVAYKVGSADEDLDHTGLAHYLEHLMFKGTEKIMPGDIDRLTLRNGGQNNAHTSENATIFYFDFAADRWQAALEIEADRMRNLRIDTKHEFEREKGAVIQELKRDEDEPWDLELKGIAPLLFGKTNPYGHPVIGEEAHVRAATAAVIKGYYDRWYHPNNASLVICGGFDPDQAMVKVRELFGPIPRGTLPPRKTVTEVSRKGPVHEELPSQFEVARMVMGFNTVRSGSPEHAALEVIEAILTGGKTGRLYKKLVEGKEIASSVDSTNVVGRYPGWFSIQVELLKGKARKEAEELVLAELNQLRDKPVSDAELKRAKFNLLAGTIFGLESVHNLAEAIAGGVTINDLEFLRNQPLRIANVTVKDVQEIARKFFDPEKRVVVWSVPMKEEGKGLGKGENGEPSGAEAAYCVRGSSHALRKASGPATRTNLTAKETGIEHFSLKKAQRVVLDNGLTLLLYENHRLPIIAGDAYVRQVRLHEPAEQAGIAALTGLMLDEGTTKHSGPGIAELIEDVGGSMSFTSSGGAVKVLTANRRLGLGLLIECLSESNFAKDAFQRKKQQQLSAIAEAEREPDTKASMAFHALVYGQHPYGRPALGRAKTVQALTPADCLAFYRRFFVPNNTILAIVGDFDSKQVLEEVTSLTANWKKAAVSPLKLAPTAKPEKFEQEILSLTKASQLHFYMGQLGIRRDNPDYYKLQVMDYVLGTGPGFTDRLSARLRDREGLAYTVSANITSSAAEEPGLFTCYIGTDPQNFARVKKEFLEELNRLRSEKPKPEEVEDAKKYLLGSFPFRFTTDGAIANQLVAVERFELGFDYYDRYQQAIAAVTPEDVQAVARKYLDPAHLVLVAAGAVDETGKALGEKTDRGEK
jgi:zinc protease